MHGCIYGSLVKKIFRNLGANLKQQEESFIFKTVKLLANKLLKKQLVLNYLISIYSSKSDPTANGV